MHPDILNKNQLAMLKKLTLPKGDGFYLAGGTALALQIGHRSSIDFDFYSTKNFSSLTLARVITKTFPNAKVVFRAPDTLRTEVGTSEFSFFYYPYRLIKPSQKFQGINLASTADIAAMKVAAIVQRGKMRDFIDIFFLLKIFSLEEIVSLAQKKYPSYQTGLILKALIYFVDAEKTDSRPIKILDPNFSWDKAKEKIFAEVKKYQLAMIKKR